MIFKKILLVATAVLSALPIFARVPATGKGFAVVELFTSEGCSSCPAAEATLAKIKSEYGGNVYVLEYHVDYWNSLGWKDMFSSHEYTQRQQKYVSLMHLNSAYTPQAIVNGSSEFVGSDYGRMKSTVERSLKNGSAVDLTLNVKEAHGTITINYALSKPTGQVLNIALVQKSTEVMVKHGENGGRKLSHTNVVRDLGTIAQPRETGIFALHLPAGVSASDCKIIAYAQNNDTWQVSAAAERGVDR